MHTDYQYLTRLRKTFSRFLAAHPEAAHELLVKSAGIPVLSLTCENKAEILNDSDCTENARFLIRCSNGLDYTCLIVLDQALNIGIHVFDRPQMMS